MANKRPWRDEFSGKIPGSVSSREIDEPSCPKKKSSMERHPRFTYRFNNRGSLCTAVFEWLIRCLQPSDRRTMLLEVISQPLPSSYPLSFFHSRSLAAGLICLSLFNPPFLRVLRFSQICILSIHQSTPATVKCFDLYSLTFRNEF